MKPNIATPVDTGEHRHKSSPAQVAEFRALLAVLDVDVGDRPGWRPARCWNVAAHSGGDRRPSLSVNVERCAWRCHACGQRGGLVGLREAAGVRMGGGGRVGTRARLAALMHLASLDGDPLAVIPAEAVEALRERTGGHRRDAVLRRNLRRVLAAVVDVMAAADHTSAVRFTALDAAERGVSARLWHELLDLLPLLGIDVARGQSGRTLGALSRGKGKGGRLLATTLTLTPSVSEYSSGDGGMGTATRDREYSDSRVEAVTVAALATRAPALDGLGLRRRPALASLLADLATHRMVAPAGDGRTLTPPGAAGRTVRELVAAHGPSIRRTLRTAHVGGLVSLVRVGRDGLVTLTAEGADLLASEAAAGAAVILAGVDRDRRRWADAQAVATRCRRERRLSHVAPWVPHAPGWVRHSITGELSPLAALRGAA